MCCEMDPDCVDVLLRRYPGAQIHRDVRTLSAVSADVCLGGWPCQDLTAAGRQSGINGKNSSLFFSMVDMAVRSSCHTIIAENVPNLLKINSGADFRVVLKTLSDSGFSSVAWRSLNARQFGLAQDRERIIIVASRFSNVAFALHRQVPLMPSVPTATKDPIIAFYWTGGKQSLCLSSGYTPALKVGASPPKGGTSPVAVFSAGKVRKLTSAECLSLQGFDYNEFTGIIEGAIFRMAGNAVPRPLGAFAADTAQYWSSAVQEMVLSRAVRSSKIQFDGVLFNNEIFSINNERACLASNLSHFLLPSVNYSLSNQAAAGLLVRLILTGRSIPIPLFDALYELSLTRTRLRGTKKNSFDILHGALDPKGYRRSLEGLCAF